MALLIARAEKSSRDQTNYPTLMIRPMTGVIYLMSSASTGTIVKYNNKSDRHIGKVATDLDRNTMKPWYGTITLENI